jgi:hypothetical protein
MPVEPTDHQMLAPSALFMQIALEQHVYTRGALNAFDLQFGTRLFSAVKKNSPNLLFK